MLTVVIKIKVNHHCKRGRREKKSATHNLGRSKRQPCRVSYLLRAISTGTDKTSLSKQDTTRSVMTIVVLVSGADLDICLSFFFCRFIIE
ncbi:hypothetical protein BDV11DRAFT_28191 [Aspergillus similis]